mgnify:CR=1 FL=1
MASTQDMIDALLTERAGYLRVGKPDRAEQVTASLRALGYEDPRPADADAPAQARGRRTAKG